MTWGYLDISFVNLKEENSQVLFSECDDDQLVLGGSSTRSGSETQPLSLFAGKEKNSSVLQVQVKLKATQIRNYRVYRKKSKTKILLQIYFM